MDLIKDLLKILAGGIIEHWAEIKVSEKRQEFFKYKGSKIAAFLFYSSIILAMALVVFGIVGIVQRKKFGVVMLIGGISIGLFLIVEWGTLE